MKRFLITAFALAALAVPIAAFSASSVTDGFDYTTTFPSQAVGVYQDAFAAFWSYTFTANNFSNTDNIGASASYASCFTETPNANPWRSFADLSPFYAVDANNDLSRPLFLTPCVSGTYQLSHSSSGIGIGVFDSDDSSSWMSVREMKSSDAPGALWYLVAFSPAQSGTQMMMGSDF